MTRPVRVSSFLLCAALAGCTEPMMEPPPEEVPMTLHDGAPVTFVPIYDAISFVGSGVTRQWLPVDVTAHPDGEVWVVQRMERDPEYDEETECTLRGLETRAPNDCVSLQGSTVAILDPTFMEPATEENVRAWLVVDANSWHFMRRPSSIAFGNPNLPFGPTDPGAMEAGLTEARTYTNTFATCAEHWTANTTDGGAFIGPSLWTADSAIYNGRNGTFSWSNGSHLDMVHATQYCMGIAYERDNVYWTFNGEEGTLDRYDFAAPHHAGHYDHDDAVVTRFVLGEGDGLSRLPFVPSNMAISGSNLFVADTGNGRVLRIDISSPVVQRSTFRTFEGLAATIMENATYEVIADAATLGAEWDVATAQPSGLALLDPETLVVADHASGNVTLLALDGTPIRTIDTATGPGLGGLTVLDGRIYFVQMTQRRVYRIDVATTAP